MLLSERQPACHIAMLVKHSMRFRTALVLESQKSHADQPQHAIQPGVVLDANSEPC